MSWSKRGTGGEGGSTVSASSTNGKIIVNGSEVTVYDDTALRNSIGPSDSKWAGKIWNVIGDSITEHNAKTTKNYHDYIKDQIGCTVNNYGISGTGWFTPSTTGGTNAIYQRLDSNIASNADLITVFAGTNDWASVGKTFVLGALGDATPATSFYGAVDNVLSRLITQYPTKTIAVFTPIQRQTLWNADNAQGVKLQQVADAIIQVAGKYSIPVLDLFRFGNMYANNSAFRSAAMPDGIHPNDTGHQILANKILAFLNTL